MSSMWFSNLWRLAATERCRAKAQGLGALQFSAGFCIKQWIPDPRWETKPLQQQLIRDQKAAVDQFRPDLVIFHIKHLGATKNRDECF